MIRVDVLTVLAPGEVLRPEAADALTRQGAVELRHFFAEGRRRPGESRVETITRARNAVRAQGDAHFVFYLDRDVVLPDRGIELLALHLHFHRHYAALGINYQEEAPRTPASHVAMGSLLTYRALLNRFPLRCEPDRCECHCYLHDLRGAGYGIDYLPGLRAQHRKHG